MRIMRTTKVSNENIGKSIIRNEYIYAIIARALTFVIALLHSVVIARYLGPSIQGITAYVSSVSSVGVILTTLGVSQAYPFYRRRSGKTEIFNEFLSVVSVMFFFYMVLSVIILFSNGPSFEAKATGLIVPLIGYFKVLEYICIIENPNAANRRSIIIHLTDLIIIVVAWFIIPRSSTVGIISLAIVPLLGLITYHEQLRPRLSLDVFRIKALVKLVKFGFFPMLAHLLTVLNYRIDILMLKQYSSVAAAHVGVYYVGISLADKIAIIPDTLKYILLSKLTKGAAEEEVAKVCRVCFAISVTISTMIILLGKILIGLLYGSEYRGAYSIVLICAMGNVFIGYFKLIAQYNIVINKQIRNLLLLSFSVTINVVLNCLLIPKHGIQGAAIASCVGYCVSGILFIIWFSHSNHVSIGKMMFIQRGDIEVIKGIGKTI